MRTVIFSAHRERLEEHTLVLPGRQAPFKPCMLSVKGGHATERADIIRKASRLSLRDERACENSYLECDA